MEISKQMLHEEVVKKNAIDLIELQETEKQKSRKVEDYYCNTETEWIKKDKQKIYDYLNGKTKVLSIPCWNCWNILSRLGKAESDSYSEWDYMDYKGMEISLDRDSLKTNSPLIINQNNGWMFNFVCSVRPCKQSIFVSNSELLKNCKEWYAVNGAK